MNKLQRIERWRKILKIKDAITQVEYFYLDSDVEKLNKHNIYEAAGKFNYNWIFGMKVTYFLFPFF